MTKAPPHTSISISTTSDLKKQLLKHRDQLQEYLGDVDVNHYIGGILEEFERNPTLYTCRPASLFESIRKAALLGLPLGQDLCYLVPYSKVCQFQVGYRGLLYLARESGAIYRHIVRSVHEGDQFDYDDGLLCWVKHERIAEQRVWENMQYVYAHFSLPNNQQHLEVMSQIDVVRHRQQYAKASGKDAPWQTNPLAMAKKTVIRRAFAGDQIPISRKLRAVITSDEFNEVIDGEVVDTSPDAAVIESIAQEGANEAGLFQKHEQTS